MQAELRYIESNDTFDWDTFAKRESSDPWNDWGWFTLEIGPKGEKGADLFQVLVCIPAAKHRTLDSKRAFRGIVVDSFDPESIQTAISSFVTSVSGLDWSDCVRKLQVALRWEYEGMS